MESVHTLRKDYPNPTQLHEVIHAYTRAIVTIWIALTPIIGFCFIIVLFIREYTLKRKVVRGDQQGQGAMEKEKAISGGTAGNMDVDVEKGGSREGDADEESEEAGEKDVIEENTGAGGTAEKDVIEERRVATEMGNSAMEQSTTEA